MGRRRTHSLEFKHEAVKLIRERGVSAAQASRSRISLLASSCAADPRDWQTRARKEA